MDREPEIIHHQMDSARASLAGHLDELERHVKDNVTEVADMVKGTIEDVRGTVESVKDSVQGTVESVKDSVQGTVENVKETMHDTVDTVKDTFDLHHQVDAHPWAMLAGAAAIGYIAGAILEPSAPARPMAHARPAEEHYAQPAESNIIKGLLVGVAMGLVRDAIMTSAPASIQQVLSGAIDDFSKRMTGQPQQASQSTVPKPQPAPAAPKPGNGNATSRYPHFSDSAGVGA